GRDRELHARLALEPVQPSKRRVGERGLDPLADLREALLDGGPQRRRGLDDCDARDADLRARPPRRLRAGRPGGPPGPRGGEGRGERRARPRHGRCAWITTPTSQVRVGAGLTTATAGPKVERQLRQAPKSSYSSSFRLRTPATKVASKRSRKVVRSRTQR